MEPRLQFFAIVGTVALLLIVLELVRRRRLLERYALLWLFSAIVLLSLGAWRGLLEAIAAVIGIAYPPSALFVIAFGFILVLLLHFSAAVSRLADQSKVLAQRLALIEERQHRLEARAGEPAAAGVPAVAEEAGEAGRWREGLPVTGESSGVASVAADGAPVAQDDRPAGATTGAESDSVVPFRRARGARSRD